MSNSYRRGGPQELNKDHVLNVVMMSYWIDGPSFVSLNGIFKSAGVSKPELYCEFGSEDQLKQSALIEYRDKYMCLIHEILKAEKYFKQGVECLAKLYQIDRESIGFPLGYLHANMCETKDQFGNLTVKTTENGCKEML